MILNCYFLSISILPACLKLCPCAQCPWVWEEGIWSPETWNYTQFLATMWVLGTEAGSSARPATTLHYGAQSPASNFTFIFETVYPWTWNSLIHSDCLVSELQISAHFYFPSKGVKIHPAYPTFYVTAGGPSARTQAHVAGTLLTKPYSYNLT